jgi:hypothetical protein
MLDPLRVARRHRGARPRWSGVVTTPPPVPAATLALFTNQRAICPACGGRREIRVHFDRDCALVRGAHFHRLCPCGHRWIEQAKMGVEAVPRR